MTLHLSVNVFSVEVSRIQSMYGLFPFFTNDVKNFQGMSCLLHIMIGFNKSYPLTNIFEILQCFIFYRASRISGFIFKVFFEISRTNILLCNANYIK